MTMVTKIKKRGQPSDVYQPVADLDRLWPKTLRGLVLGLDGLGCTSGAWVGGVVFYGMLESI
jgi:hypothetical protein